MKQYSTILILVVAGLFSCEDEGPLLTPNLVSSVKAYDLDNNGNSSDIRVDFEVKDNLNVIEYRVMVVPSGFSNSFDENDAASIPSASYLRIEPEVFKNEHSIKRLPSGFLDVNGEQIQSNLEYVAAVFVKGTGRNQLSEFSRPFRLKDRGIYSGRYTVGWEHSCVNKVTGLMTPEDSPLDGLKFLELEPSGDRYEGGIQCPDCPEAEEFSSSAGFLVAGTSISNSIFFIDRICTLDLSINGCTVGELCSFFALGGEGNIIDELIMEIVHTGEDCVRTCEGTIFLVRQG